MITWDEAIMQTTIQNQSANKMFQVSCTGTTLAVMSWMNKKKEKSAIRFILVWWLFLLRILWMKAKILKNKEPLNSLTVDSGEGRA